MHFNRIITASRGALRTQKANTALFTKSAMKPIAVKGKKKTIDWMSCLLRCMSFVGRQYATEATPAGQIR
jgi:F-type H+-transporting ATPase subunit beta